MKKFISILFVMFTTFSINAQTFIPMFFDSNSSAKLTTHEYVSIYFSFLIFNMIVLIFSTVGWLFKNRIYRNNWFIDCVWNFSDPIEMPIVSFLNSLCFIIVQLITLFVLIVLFVNNNI